MKKNYLFDVDGLLQVLQAIKEGEPVEYRPLEEPNLREFNPEICSIDTENCKYRVKPCKYGDSSGIEPIRPEDLEEARIYLLRSRDSGNDKGFLCVKSNMWKWNKLMSLHFSYIIENPSSAVLSICDPNAWKCSHSEYSESFANSISANLVVHNFDNVVCYEPSLAQVQMLESKLREIGYEFKNGEMIKIDGNEE